MKGKRKNNKKSDERYYMVWFYEEGEAIIEYFKKHTYQIRFYEKAPKKIITHLKKNGFKWDKRKNLWSAPVTRQSFNSANKVVDEYFHEIKDSNNSGQTL